MARVDLRGSAWCPTDVAIAPPTIFGDVRRDDVEIVGVLVGVTARSVSPNANAWEVEPEPDAVMVPRLPDEPLYVLDRPSLTLRVAAEHGTSKAWALSYSE